jgi:hypothetical protein
MEPPKPRDPADGSSRSDAVRLLAGQMEDAAAEIEGMLNALWRIRTDDGSQPPLEPCNPHLASAEQMVGIAWESLRIGVDLLRGRRPPMSDEQRPMLSAIDQFLAENR